MATQNKYVFSVLQLNSLNYLGNDWGGCLYNGVKLVAYFSHCIGSASLCSILKMHPRISQLQST